MTSEAGATIKPIDLEPTLDLSVVVPVYNEAENLPELVERVRDSVSPLGSYELILVDDGSTDSSWPTIAAEAARDPAIVGLRLQRNFGQHPAVSAGFDRARGRVVVTLDADLQNPPEEIPRLVARLGDDCDVASGWRQQREDTILRTLPSKLVNVMIGRLTRVKLRDYGCMLRAHKREVIQMLSRCPEAHKFITALTSWLGAQIVEVPVRHDARKAGTSRYRFWRLMRMNFDVLTAFSTDLLQIVSVTGIVVAFAGLAAGVILGVWRVIHGSGLLGLNTFVALLLFLSGLQLAAVGVVGEYVGRVFVQVQGRPYYLVKTQVGGSGTADA